MSRILRALAASSVATIVILHTHFGTPTAASSAGGLLTSMDEPSPSRGDVLRAEHGTYIAHLLRERDSTFNRWPNRLGAPIRVWIEPTTDVFTDGVREAFTTWASIG